MKKIEIMKEVSAIEIYEVTANCPNCSSENDVKFEFESNGYIGGFQATCYNCEEVFYINHVRT